MKNGIRYLAIVAALIAAFALSSFRPGNGGAGVPEYTFKSVDEEVAMEIERGKGEVLLHLLVKDMAQYDHIVIERSAESANYFGKCKYITCAGQKTENGYLLQVDKYPFAANKDVYYRIKTVTRDGIERSYPSVKLESASK